MNGDESVYKNGVLKELKELKELKLRYNDTDGKYTNGKGVVGALIEDLTVSTQSSL